MSFSRKVNLLLKEQNMTKAMLAKETGIPYTTLDSMLKRETDTERLATVFRLARALGTSVEELVFDEEKKEASLSQEEKRILELYSLLDSRGKNTVLSLLEREADNSRDTQGLRSLPVYEAPAAAGDPLPVYSEEKGELFYREGEVPKKADFGIRISGDSMEPLFSDGDIAYVQKNESLLSGDVGIFLLNGESLCKKLVTKGGKTYLHSLNPKYLPIPVLATDELKAVGKVIVS